MHQTALCKVRIFLAEYVTKDTGSGQKKLLDVGACVHPRKNASGDSDSAPRLGRIRGMCKQAGVDYVGLDIVPGSNVDVVAKRPFVWDEIENESFDYVVSTSTFEHNPFFWVTFAEIARVLKQGGKTLVTAPGAGSVHRYPLDCWRFYPDSWAVLCALTGLEIDEVINEPRQSKGVLKGAQWWDSLVIATKPTFTSPIDADQFYGKLRPLVEPYGHFQADVQPVAINSGPVFREYMKFIRRQAASQSSQPSPLEGMERSGAG